MLGGGMSDCDNVNLDAVGRSEVRIDELLNLEIFLTLGRLPRYGSMGYWSAGTSLFAAATLSGNWTTDCSITFMILNVSTFVKTYPVVCLSHVWLPSELSKVKYSFHSPCSNLFLIFFPVCFLTYLNYFLKDKNHLVISNRRWVAEFIIQWHVSISGPNFHSPEDGFVKLANMRHPTVKVTALNMASDADIPVQFTKFHCPDVPHCWCSPLVLCMLLRTQIGPLSSSNLDPSSLCGLSKAWR